VKQRLNVDSPSFTPLTAAVNGSSGSRSTTISPKAASAAPFTPKSQKKRKLPYEMIARIALLRIWPRFLLTATTIAELMTHQPEATIAPYQSKDIQEFVPQSVTPSIPQAIPQAQEYAEFVPHQYEAQIVS
jgi:hypothetical protein